MRNTPRLFATVAGASLISGPLWLNGPSEGHDEEETVLGVRGRNE